MPTLTKQNVTISLSPDLVRKVKVLAARRSSSISRLLAEYVEAIVKTDDAYELARVSAMSRMEQGLHLGGGPYGRRDDLYDR